MKEFVCPLCFSSYVHHTKVEVFERKEDEEGLHVSVSGGEVKINTDLSNNPSPRRHGLLIHFWCEGCMREFTCFMAQHKGQTLVKYERVEQ